MAKKVDAETIAERDETSRVFSLDIEESEDKFFGWIERADECGKSSRKAKQRSFAVANGYERWADIVALPLDQVIELFHATKDDDEGKCFAVKLISRMISDKWDSVRRERLVEERLERDRIEEDKYRLAASKIGYEEGMQPTFDQIDAMLSVVVNERLKEELSSLRWKMVRSQQEEMERQSEAEQLAKIAALAARSDRSRRAACKKLGIDFTKLVYGAQAAADALGVGVELLKRHVEPADHRPNPKYKCAPDVGMYDPIDLAAALKIKAVAEAREKHAARCESAERAVKTRMRNMEEKMRTVELTIVAGWTESEIESLARRTHGGNYRGDPGPFYFCDSVARNCIRHNLTNYEDLWSEINRGYTGSLAYQILRERIDALVDEAYPQYSGRTKFAEGIEV